MSWLKKRLPKKRWKRVCIYLLSIFVILLAADMLLVQYWRHITISPETTRITSPLKPDGLPDYVAARNAECSQGVTVENNAAPELLAISNVDQLDYTHWFTTRHPHDDVDEEWQETMHKPWKSHEHPDRVAWLNSQRSELAQLDTALGKERFYVPWNSASPGANTSAVVPWLALSHSYSYLLAADAMRAAGDGDAATFQKDVMNMEKLAGLVSNGSTLIEYLEAEAIQCEASWVAQHGAATLFLKANEAGILLQSWLSTPAFPDESRILDTGERFFSLSTFCEASQIGLRAAMGGDPPPMNSMQQLLVPIHYNGILGRFNHYFDELVAVQRLPTYKQRSVAMKAVEAEATARHNFLDIGEVLVGVLAPSFDRTLLLQERTLVNHDLATVALALRIYREEHGAFPGSLVDLSPGILAAVPTDGFADDAPFHYRREGSGYVLYSVGDDGKDDGGLDRKEAAKAGVNGWDIVVRCVE
jgi:hypothetical protein